MFGKKDDLGPIIDPTQPATGQMIAQAIASPAPPHRIDRLVKRKGRLIAQIELLEAEDVPPGHIIDGMKREIIAIMVKLGDWHGLGLKL